MAEVEAVSKMRNDDDQSSSALQKQVGVALSTALGELLVRALSGPAEQAGGIAEDWLREKRQTIRRERGNRFAKQTNEALKDKGVGDETRPVPTIVALRIVEEATLEDDNFLQDQWARLLATAMDPNGVPVKRSYIGIMRELEPLDARLLSFLAAQGWELSNVHWHPQGSSLQGDVGPEGFTTTRLVESLGVPEREVQISLLNLFRLGCVADEVPETWDSAGTTSAGLRVHHAKAIFRPTQLGFDFVEASQDER